MRENEDSSFTVLENKSIGRNLSTFRKLRDKKALEVADYLGIKEATYTKYERGESKITIDLIQRVAEFLNVDPLQIVAAQPGHYVESIKGSNIAIQTNSTYRAGDDKQTEVMMKMMETMMQMNEAIKKILESKRQESCIKSWNSLEKASWMGLFLFVGGKNSVNRIFFV